MRRPQARILTLQAAVSWRQALSRAGLTLAVTNGCFDVLHAGHAIGLQEAREEADALVVLVNSDASVRALKGPSRPVIPQAERALLLASLRCVDAVVVFDGTDCSAELLALRPDVYAKSDEYRGMQHPAEKAALASVEAYTAWLPRLPGLSTTDIVRRIADGALPRTPAGDLESPPHPPLKGTPADTEGVGRASASASPARPSIDASTRGDDSNRPAAGDGGADAAGSAGHASVPAVARVPEGSGESATPRLPEAVSIPAGHTDLTGTRDWGVP